MAPSLFFYLPNDWPPLPTRPHPFIRQSCTGQLTVISTPPPRRTSITSIGPTRPTVRPWLGPTITWPLVTREESSIPPVSTSRATMACLPVVLYGRKSVRSRRRTWEGSAFFAVASRVPLDLSHPHFPKLNTIRFLRRYAASWAVDIRCSTRWKWYSP